VDTILVYWYVVIGERTCTYTLVYIHNFIACNSISGIWMCDRNYM